MTNVQDAVQRQFGQVAANYTTSLVHASGEDLSRMVQIAALNGSERVLDAGCGAGHTAFAFAPYVAQVVAADITPAMLAQAEQNATHRGLTNVITQRGDVEQLPFEDASFDVVTSRYSAHHWPHPQAALAEFRRVLKPGGRFILSDIVALPDPTYDTFLQALEVVRDYSHVRDHSVEQWQAMLTDSGFTAEVAFNWEVDLEFTSWIARMATPVPNIAMIKSLFDSAPQHVREALRIQPDYSFTLKGALFTGKLCQTQFEA